MKDLFNLPVRTPTAALVYTFGILYSKQRVDKIQLIYLHKILSKTDVNWLKGTLMMLQTLNIGWYKEIKATLETYGLTTDFEAIKSRTANKWKAKVSKSVEVKNKERLINDLYKAENGILTPKT